MVQITNLCSKCRNEIEPGKENYIQLIDRQNISFYANKSGGVVLPTTKWEWCLCPKCFEAFNKEMAFPYKENEVESKDNNKK